MTTKNVRASKLEGRLFHVGRKETVDHGKGFGKSEHRWAVCDIWANDIAHAKQLFREKYGPVRAKVFWFGGAKASLPANAYDIRHYRIKFGVVREVMGLESIFWLK